MTITVYYEDEQGTQQIHEVSDDFMELCFARAKIIAGEVVELATRMSSQQWYDTIKDKAGENTNKIQQCIIIDMVKDILKEGMKQSMLEMLFNVSIE